MFTILTSFLGNQPKTEASLCSSEGFPPLVDAIAGLIMIIAVATFASGTISTGGTYALIAFGSAEIVPLLQHVLSALRTTCFKKQEPRHSQTPEPKTSHPTETSVQQIPDSYLPKTTPSDSEETAERDPALDAILQDATLQGSNLGSHFANS